MFRPIFYIYTFFWLFELPWTARGTRACSKAVAVFSGSLNVALWGFSTLRPSGLLYSYPQQVPAFISRGATHHTDARDLCQRRRELLPMNFASKSVIHENSLGSFICRKDGTCDILFYFPSEGRHTEDFPGARKIQRLRPSLNPWIRVPLASMLTTRPPKPSQVPFILAVRIQLVNT